MTGKQKLTSPEAVEQMNKVNLTCADIIVVDSKRYPGIMQEWAMAIYRRWGKGYQEKMEFGN